MNYQVHPALIAVGCDLTGVQCAQKPVSESILRQVTPINPKHQMQSELNSTYSLLHIVFLCLLQEPAVSLILSTWAPVKTLGGCSVSGIVSSCGSTTPMPLSLASDCSTCIKLLEAPPLSRSPSPFRSLSLSLSLPLPPSLPLLKEHRTSATKSFQRAVAGAATAGAGGGHLAGAQEAGRRHP